MKAFLAKLDRETLILDLGRDIDQPPALEGINARLVDPHTLEVEVSKAAPLNAIFAQLIELDIPVTSMRNKANRLEELFVSLVERKR